MTKLKKSVACIAACVMLAGAGLSFRPAQHTAYAEGAGTNSWLVVPRINGWEYGSFSQENNMFTAVPEYGAEYEANSMIFSFEDGDGARVTEDVYVTVDRSAGYSFSYYHQSPYPAYDLDNLSMTFNSLEPGSYIMTVTLNANMPDYAGLSAAVPFKVSKARNYWTQTPSILSWYEDDLGGYPEPSAAAAHGTATFTIYGLMENTDGTYVTNNGGYVIDKSTVYNNPKEMEAGTYALVAKVEETERYEGLETTVFFRVFTGEATLKALAQAKETAADELRAYASGLGVEISNDIIGGIDSAETLKEVSYWLENSKFRVYQDYAVSRIQNYVAELNGLYEINISYNSADDENAIRQADDYDTVKQRLDSALEKIYDAGVSLKKQAVTKAVQEDAGRYNVSYEPGILINPARTFEETEEALYEAQKEIIELVLANTLRNNSVSLETYKMNVQTAISRYAAYVGVDTSSASVSEIITLYTSRVTLAETKESALAVYQSEEPNASTAKTVLDGVRSNVQSQLTAALTETVSRYQTLYPTAAGDLDAILNEAYENKTISGELTIPRSERAYESVLADVRECVLGYARDQAIAEIEKAVLEAGLEGFDLEAVEDAIRSAADIDEVEIILNSALTEIGSTLYSVRSEKIKELESFAIDYFTDYNWHALFDALTEGKDAINAAQTYSAILQKSDDVKLSFIYAYVLAELDRYADVYGSYNIVNAIEVGKSALSDADTEEEYFSVLADAEAGICAAAKVKAIADLTSYNDYYPSWDRRESVQAITNAESVAKVDELYQQAYAALTLLINQRESAITAAQSMLTVYAENLGVEDLSAVKEAIQGIRAAQTTEEVPQLFDTAKTTIDRAADAEQQRITASNKAAIAFAVIFAFATAGLGVALGILIYRMKSGKKKNPKNPKGTPPQGQQGQQPPQQPQYSQQAQQAELTQQPQYSQQPQQAEQPQQQVINPPTAS